VSCWGLDDHFQAGNINSTVPSLDADECQHVERDRGGKSHSCLLTPFGGGGSTVFCWGANGAHQAGAQADNPVPKMVAGVSTSLMALGDDHSCAGVNGGVLCWGGDNIVGSGSAMPVLFATGWSSAAIGAGDRFNCARTASGEIYCWGLNDVGQLGDGTLTTKKLGTSLPKVPLPKPAVGMTVGTAHACAWTSSEAWCWGNGALGQLGNGSVADATLPKSIALPP